MNEFEIIEKYFSNWPISRKEVVLGVGDDAALLQPSQKNSLVVSTDTLIETVHFPKHAPAEAIAHRALAVNLSDLAAMGAEPFSFTLALTLPRFDKNWLSDFRKGLLKISRQCQLVLVGGNLAKGPLSMTISIMGQVPAGKAILRSGARVGDKIYITGMIGRRTDFFSKDFYYFLPPIALGLFLRKFATSAIDISDGLLADLSHLLKASKKGATIYLEKIPMLSKLSLFSGDDYELCFTVPAQKEKNFLVAYAGLKKRSKLYPDITCIGRVEQKIGLRALDIFNQPVSFKRKGYQHFE